LQIYFHIFVPRHVYKFYDLEKFIHFHYIIQHNINIFIVFINPQLMMAKETKTFSMVNQINWHYFHLISIVLLYNNQTLLYDCTRNVYITYTAGCIIYKNIYRRISTKTPYRIWKYLWIYKIHRKWYCKQMIR
jgi:hypothetical protein